MKYRQIKWLILLLPTITIGIWEYVRHEYLLPYLSMEMGNILSPIIVFAVTVIILIKLFAILEGIQEELKTEKARKAALIERENLARELHDGIAQSLFLLSVNLNRFGEKAALETDLDFQKTKQILQRIYEDTRQAIQNLKQLPSQELFSWTKNIQQYLTELENNYPVDIDFQWEIQDQTLSAKEKIELFACIREAVMNVIKHARTNKVWILAKESMHGWTCEIRDQGVGFSIERNQMETGLGLQIIEKRAEAMNWQFSIQRIENETVILLKKEQKIDAD
ncbi:sensor histidine kinase [Bacillus cihuensis]|uniref:sensor histidine kinase n=1 Tax=Bacillus cihuensis TaxID=1208599 RepID=UPI0003F4EFD0|nr:histidine kinase [Bacillus cihuensis]